MIKCPIIITGFMASGKTTVARALALALGCQSLDLDQFIAERTGRSPKEIIEQDGEAAFREVETNYLREALELESAGVIALGGGAWTIELNRRLIGARGGVTVWLDAPFELCWQRISASGTERPLGRLRGNALQRYNQRQPIYGLADLRLSTVAKKSVDEVVEEIKRSIVKEA
jgi:shikimate kinase